MSIGGGSQKIAYICRFKAFLEASVWVSRVLLKNGLDSELSGLVLVQR